MVYAKKLKVLLATLAAMVLLVGAGVAYANSTQDTSTGTGDNGTRVSGHDESDGPGDSDGLGDSEGSGNSED